MYNLAYKANTKHYLLYIASTNIAFEKAVHPGRDRCHAQEKKFSNVLYIVPSYREYARVPTFENVLCTLAASAASAWHNCPREREGGKVREGER